MDYYGYYPIHNESIILYMLFIGIYKKIKNINIDKIMYITGCGLALFLSSLSGYVFFNFSSMTMAIILIILLKKCDVRGEK